MKDHNSRSGNNRKTFDYFDEIDAVLGCKPNIAPKRVFECGFSEDASSSSVETGDSADPPQSSGQGDQSSEILNYLQFLDIFIMNSALMF